MEKFQGFEVEFWAEPISWSGLTKTGFRYCAWIPLFRQGFAVPYNIVGFGEEDAAVRVQAFVTEFLGRRRVPCYVGVIPGGQFEHFAEQGYLGNHDPRARGMMYAHSYMRDLPHQMSNVLFVPLSTMPDKETEKWRMDITPLWLPGERLSMWLPRVAEPEWNARYVRDAYWMNGGRADLVDHDTGRNGRLNLRDFSVCLYPNRNLIYFLPRD